MDIELAQALKENAKLQQACHKWFMRWREAKKDALYFDSSLQKQIEATLKLQQENAELKTKKIPELERKIASIRGSHRVDVKKLNARTEQVERLQKENAELKEALKGKVCNCMTYLNFKDLEKENAELKAQLESERDLPAIAYMQGAEKQKKKDEEELQKWKDEWQEQVQKANDEGYARTLQTMQLSKAKEIIKDLLSFVDSLGNYSGGIFNKAEQFLKGE